MFTSSISKNPLIKYSLLMAAALLTTVSAAARHRTYLPLAPRHRAATTALDTRAAAGIRRAPLQAAAETATRLYVGYVDDETNYQVVNFNGGYYEFASWVNPSLISKYVGNKIVGVRFLLNSTDLAAVKGWLTADPEDENAILASGDLAKVDVEDWNTVIFSQPYTITGAADETLFMGFNYTSTSSADDDYPLVIAPGVSTQLGFCLGTDFGDGNGFNWYDASSYYGTLALQLIIEGDLPDYDVALENFSLEKPYVKAADGQFRFYVELTNAGSKPLNGVNLEVLVDGNPIGSFSVTEPVTGTMQLMQPVSFADLGLALGKHTFGLVATEQADGTPFTKGYTEDDSVLGRFALYENASTRTGYLFEIYANQYSYNDPLQLAALQTLQQTRADIVPVVLHGDYYGEELSSDVFATDEALLYANLFYLEGTPSIGINRLVFPGSESLLQTISQASIQSGYLASILDEYIADIAPAFGNVSITDATIADNRLSFTVNATRGGDFRNIFGNGALTVYLTEDSLVAMQEGPEETLPEYVHNNVLRRVVSAPLGDELLWVGLRASMTYTVELDPAWRPGNMHIVAALHKAVTDDSTLDDVDVTDATQLALSSLTAVRDLRDPSQASSSSSLIDLTGRTLAAPTRPGLYIRGGKKVIVR